MIEDKNLSEENGGLSAEEEDWLEEPANLGLQIPIWISELRSEYLEHEEYKKAGIILTEGRPNIHTLILRDYQINAIKALERNEAKGILQMATGTGKTKTLIGFLYRYWLKTRKNQDSKEIMPILAIILVPGTSLLIQWKQTLSHYFNHVYCLYGYPKAQEELHNALILYDYGYSSFTIILISQQSIKKLFLDPYFKSKTSFLLIADEVHQFGSEKTMKLLEKLKTNYKIGLSATPTRQFDEHGTIFLFRQFHGIIFRYGLKEAIEEGYLVPYEYEYELCELSDEEQERYSYLTKKILIENSKSEKKRDEEKIEQLLIRRALFIKKAKSKLFSLEIIFQRLQYRNIKDHIVVFLEDEEQCNQIIPLVQQFFQNYEIYDAETTPKNRQRIIEEFEQGNIQIVLTKRCWDQGIDIPSLKAGIIVSSTTNERQLIQRIGRLLRPYPGKSLVFVFDLVVQKYCEDLTESNDFDNLFTAEYNRMLFLKENAKMNYTPN